MIFKYCGVKFEGTREQILKKIETSYSLILTGKYLWVGGENRLITYSMNLDIVKQQLIEKIKLKVPFNRTASIIGDFILVYDYTGNLIREISIYGI